MGNLSPQAALAAREAQGALQLLDKVVGGSEQRAQAAEMARERFRTITMGAYLDA